MRKKKGKELIRHMMKKNRIEAQKNRLEKREKNDFDHEMIPLPHQSLDKNGNIIAVNDKWIAMFGYTKKEVVGKNFSKFIKEKKLFKKRFAKFKACGVSKDADFVMIKKNDEEIDVTIDGRAEYDKNHHFIKTHCVIKDVAEPKKTEESLKQSEEKYRCLFENMQDGFAYHKIVLDKNKKPIDYIFLEANDSFEKYTGLKKGKIIGKKVTEVIPGIKKAKPDLISVYGDVALGGKEKKFRLYFEPFKKWYLISCYSPKKGYFATSFSDITDEKAREHDLSERHKELRGIYELSKLLFEKKDVEEIIKIFQNEILPRSMQFPEKVVSKIILYKKTYTNSDHIDLSKKSKVLESNIIVNKINKGKLIVGYTDKSLSFIKDYEQRLIDGYTNLIGMFIEQQKTDESLRKEKDFISNILDTMGDGVDIVNENCEVEFMNKAFLDVFGKKAIGKKCYKVYKMDKKQCLSCPLKENLIPGKTSALRVSKIVGGKTFQITYTSFKDKDGKIKILEIFRDVTEQKLADEKLKRKIDELEQFQKIIVGREMKMVELKEKLEERKKGEK